MRDSGGSGQDRSIEQQRQVVFDYCTQYGLRLIHLFEEPAISGKSTAGRTQFDQMLSLSTQADKPHGLLIWNFARFARNTDDSQIYKGILRKRGIIIHSLTNQIPEGPFAAVIETLIHVADEQKRAEAAAGAWRGLHSIVAQGAVPGTPPRGFKREPITIVSERGVQRTAHRWVPDPDVVPMIRQAFSMRAAGESLISIKTATRLYNDLNSYTTFYRNRIYIGILDYGDQSYPGYCEPIIDETTWNAVQKIAEKNASRQHVKSDGHNHPRRKNSSFLLAGLAYCARCGSPLYGQNSPRGSYATDRSYRCTRGKRTRDCDLPRIPAYTLEQNILDGLNDLGNNPSYVAEMHRLDLEGSQNAVSETDSKRQKITTDLKTIRAKLSRLANAIADDGHTRAIMELNKSLEMERDDLERQLRDLAGKKVDGAPADPNEIRDYLLAIRPAVEAASLSDAQTIMRAILARAVVERIDKELYIGIDVRVPKKKVHPPPETDNINCVPLFSIPLGAQVYRHTIIGTVKQKPRSK